MKTGGTIIFILFGLFALPCFGQTGSPRPPTLDPFGMETQPKPLQAEISSEDMIRDLLNPLEPIPFEMQTDLDEAKRLATAHRRPILVIFGAAWCSWCKKLEADLDQDAADTIFEKWIVANIDVDESPDVANQFQVDALPNLQIMDSGGEAIASSSGYLPPVELAQWLDANFEAASPALPEILLTHAVPDEEGVATLIGLLASKSKSTRSAAKKRLEHHRPQTANAVVQSFVEDRLIQKLAAWEVLRAWKAPIANIDPWQPESYTEASITALREWSSKKD